MSLFSPAAESLLRQRGSIPTQPLPGAADPIAVSAQKGLSSLSGTMAGMYRSERAREMRLKDTTYVAAGNVAQSRFDWELKRELGRFYTSDGRDLTPGSGYTKDLGFGITLTTGDFIDNESTNQRRTYTDLVRHMHDKFLEARLKVAPSERAEAMSRVRLEQGKLSGEMGAMKFSAARREVVLANNLNAVVRAYKETLAGTKGYDPTIFGLHVNALLEASNTEGSVDPGKARMAALASIGDLVRVGVTEAHTDRDNRFALATLAASPLRNTEMLERAMSGLQGADKTYIRGLTKVSDGRKRLYKRGDSLPGNKTEEYLAWAMAQLSEKERGQIQERAVKALTAQTQVARVELGERLKGLQTAMNSAQIKEPGFREMVRTSLTKSLQDTQRLYPKNLFPIENARNAATALVLGELMELRSTMDDTHTSILSSYIRNGTLASSLNSKVQNTLGSSGSILYSQAIVEAATKLSANFIASELKSRAADPYGTIIRTTKDVKALEEKLATGNFATENERYRDQATLRSRVLARSAELGVRPSFLTGSDAGTLKNLAALGNPVMTEGYVRKVREKYGEGTFFDYVLPEIAADKVVGPATLPYAMLPNGQVWQIVASAQADSAKYDKVLKEKGIDIEKFNGEMADISKASWYEWGPFADSTTDRVMNAISDRFGDGYEGQRARIAAFGGISNLAKSMIATGRETSFSVAVRKALQLYEEGMGNPVSMDGRDTISYAPVTLNEPRMDRLAEVVKKEGFLRENVFPHIAPNPMIIERARREGEDPYKLMYRYFTDDDLVKWVFGTEGLVPKVESEYSADFSSGIPRKDGGGFVIPYEDFADVILWQGDQ